MSKPEIPVVARLWPSQLQSLREAFVMRARFERAGPATLVELAPRVWGIAVGGTWETRRALADLALRTGPARFAGKPMPAPVAQ